MGGVSSRCRKEKKEEKKREHKPEGTRGCTRPEVFGKDAMKKGDRNHPNSMQHGNSRIERLNDKRKRDKIPSAERSNCAPSSATVKGRRLLYNPCAQDFYGANQRLSLEKNHGHPFKKACSKPCGSSSAQGGHRIRLRPQWPGVVQRRPRKQASPIQFSHKVIA